MSRLDAGARTIVQHSIVIYPPMTTTADDEDDNIINKK